MRLFALSLFLLVLTAAPLMAHSGDVAIAVPAKDIVVDGDLSDWPEGAVSYPLTHYIDDPGYSSRLSRRSRWWEDLDLPGGDADLSAHVSFAYSAGEAALFVGIHVRDDDVNLSPFDAVRSPFQSVDGSLIFLVPQHDPRRFEYAGGYFTQGDQVETYRLINNTGTVAHPTSPEDVDFAVTSTREGLSSEWRFDLNRATDGALATLSAGDVVGIAVLVRDRDADGSFSVAGLDGIREDVMRTIDLVLAPPTHSSGVLEGRAAWQDMEARGNRTVHIAAPGAPAAFSIRTDSTGRFHTDLPAGAYEVVLNDSVRRQVTVIAEDTNEIGSIAFPPVEGDRRRLGPGTEHVVTGQRLPARVGDRVGYWQKLDGLPDPSIAAVFEDRDGYLWFATRGGGLCRFDGLELYAITSDDGLPGSTINDIVQTPDGAIWIGLQSGLARLVGGQLTTFGLDDGLLGRVIQDLHVDTQGDLWIASNMGITRLQDDQLTNYTIADGIPSGEVWSIIDDGEGGLFVGTTAGVVRHDGRRVVAPPHSDMQSVSVRSLLRTDDGALWMGSFWDQRIYRCLDGEMQDMTPPDWRYGVQALFQDTMGDVWVGSRDGGLLRWNGSKWRIYGDDGPQKVQSITQTTDGDLWFATGSFYTMFYNSGDGAVRYDGYSRMILTTQDGLSSNYVWSVAEASDGAIWIGTRQVTHILSADTLITIPVRDVWHLEEDAQQRMLLASRSEGLLRYDRGKLENVTDRLGVLLKAWWVSIDHTGGLWLTGQSGKALALADSGVIWRQGPDDGLQIKSILRDGDDLWIGHNTGFERRRDGVVVHRHEDGSTVNAIRKLSDGIWMLGNSGAVRYQPEMGYTRFTRADGLGHNVIRDVAEDARGHLWFATFGGGVTQYDGTVFQILDTQDGLPSNALQENLPTSDGSIWITSESGITRYIPSSTPPRIEITEVIADRRLDATGPIQIPSSQKLLSIEYLGRSLTSRPDQIVYLSRIRGYDEAWAQTHDRQVIYEDLPVGDYIFEVKAVDRDLNYSKPARLQVRVHADYGRIALQAGLALSMIGLLLAGGYGIRRQRGQRRAEQALMQELEGELQEARQMQMGLMPTSPPAISGLSIAGVCQTANHVGGDLFQYFSADNGISIATADVTGHAMEAAIPVVMFSGILDQRMEIDESLPVRFQALNRSLCRSLSDHKFICFTMAHIEHKHLRLASCGNPYPLHVSRGVVKELRVDGYPLGVREDTPYEAIEVDLQIGDYLVFYSDGIPETVNSVDEMFGYEQTMETVRQGCADRVDAQELVERLMHAARSFAADEPQADDMTCVVVKVES
jgi:ligand-binding sensor domain-containing protein